MAVHPTHGTLGAIENALFRAGASRLDGADFAYRILASGSPPKLEASTLRRSGVFPDILARELHAMGLAVRLNSRGT